MTEKSITLTSLIYHEHYDHTGARVAHPPGDVYTLHDADGMTAEQLASSFEAMKIAKRVEDGAPTPAKAGKPVKPMTTNDLSKR